MQNYISAQQLSEKLAGRSVRSIQRDVKSGALPKPYRVSGTLMWDESEVDQHIKSNNAKAKPMTRLAEIQSESHKFRDEHISANRRKAAAQTELLELKTKRNDAKKLNEAEIGARAEALAEATGRQDAPMIDLAELDAGIAVQQSLAEKLGDVSRTKRSEQIKLSKQFYNLKADITGKQFDETGFVVKDVGGRPVARKSFEAVGEMTLNELLATCQLRNMSKCHQGYPDKMSIWSFLSKHVLEPKSETVSTFNAAIDSELGL